MFLLLFCCITTWLLKDMTILSTILSAVTEYFLLFELVLVHILTYSIVQIKCVPGLYIIISFSN